MLAADERTLAFAENGAVMRKACVLSAFSRLGRLGTNGLDRHFKTGGTSGASAGFSRRRPPGMEGRSISGDVESKLVPFVHGRRRSEGMFSWHNFWESALFAIMMSLPTQCWFRHLVSIFGGYYQTKPDGRICSRPYYQGTPLLVKSESLFGLTAQ